MAKVQVTVCDVCSGGVDDNGFIVTLKQGKHEYKGDVCVGCVTKSGWDLPAKTKRNYTRKDRNFEQQDPHAVTRLHSQKM